MHITGDQINPITKIMQNNPSITSKASKLSILLLAISLTFCQTGRRSSSANVFLSYSMAIEQFQSNNYEDALKYINEAIGANNKIAQYFELKGDIYIASNEPKKALREYQAAKELRFSPGILIKLGNTHYQLDDLISAVKNFKTAYNQKPEWTETLLLLVNCFIQQKEYELAINNLKDYKKQSDKINRSIMSEYYILYGKVYYEKSMFKECVKIVEEAKGSINRNESIFYLNALFEIGEYERAYNLVINDLGTTLHLSDIHYFRGLYYYSVGNFGVAQIQLELSVNNNISISRAYLLLAQLYEKDGDIKRANELKESGKEFENQRIINIGL